MKRSNSTRIERGALVAILAVAQTFSVHAGARAQGTVEAPGPAAAFAPDVETDETGSQAATGAGFPLAHVLALAAARNPGLRAMRASAAAAASRVGEASTLPDPVFQLGVMNLSVPDLNADMAASMAPSVQLMQMVPFPGKLALMGEAAEAAWGIAEATAEETWWEVRERSALLFYELYSLDQRIRVMRNTRDLLQDFQAVAKAMYGAGTGRQADVLRADVEVARMDAEVRKMEAMRVGMAAHLNALLDRPAATLVPSPDLGLLPLSVPPPDTLRTWAAETRPLLARARLGVTQAKAMVRLAKKEIWPDLTLGVQYGQRPGSMGTERMGSAMVGFTLPVHAGKRQLAMRDETMAMQRMTEAELGSMTAMVDARIGELLAELERARSLVRLYQGEVLPGAKAMVESALSSYRVGSVDFMTLVDAQMTVNRYEGELYELLADYGKAVAGIESAVGRPLPLPGEVLTEDR